MASGAFVGAIFGFTVGLYSNAVILNRSRPWTSPITSLCDMDRSNPCSFCRSGSYQSSKHRGSMLCTQPLELMQVDLHSCCDMQLHHLYAAATACIIMPLCQRAALLPFRAAQHLLCLSSYYMLQALHMQQVTVYRFVPCKVEPGMSQARTVRA